MSKNILNYSILTRIKQTPSLLDKIAMIMDWVAIKTLLSHNLKNRTDAVGNRAYPPLKMFKVLLLQTLFDLSDREMDESLFDRVSFRKFAGFIFELKTPSYTTICRFRNKIIRQGLDHKLFKLINNHLMSNKLIVKKGIVVDASIIKSARRPRKIISISKQNKTKILYSKDLEAKWTIKGGIPYYGYKLHMSTDSRHGFILGGHITSANRADTTELSTIIQEAKPQKGAFILADKGYSSKNNRNYLGTLGFKDGIMHKANVGKKLTELQKNMNAKISSVRGIVERTFGTLKEKYSFHRAKYLGIIKLKGQFLLSAMVLNLKKAANFVE